MDMALLCAVGAPEKKLCIRKLKTSAVLLRSQRLMYPREHRLFLQHGMAARSILSPRVGFANGLLLLGWCRHPLHVSIAGISSLVVMLAGRHLVGP